MTPFEIAKGELGQQEIAGKNHNPRIVEYHKETSLKASDDETPWCAAFVNWCMKKAGVKGTNSAMARSFLSWGKITDTPRAGDIVILKRGTSAVTGHVGFVYETPSKLNPFVKVLGGNQNNQVCVAKYLRANVLGYRKEF